jgi:hypothetical protein
MDTPKSPDSSTSPQPQAVSSTAVQVQRAATSTLAASSAPSATDAATAAFNELLGPDLARLNHAQVIALRLLLNGQNDIVIGRAVGKHPGTISRWKNAHPVFRRCMGAWRQAQKTTILDGLFDLSEPALDNVRADVLKGNSPRLSFAILKYLASLNPNTIDPPPMPNLPSLPGPGNYGNAEYAAPLPEPMEGDEDEHNDPDDEGFSDRRQP